MNKHKPCGPYERFVKRPLDLFCAILAVVLFFWLYVILAVLVRVKLGSPILFKQKRPGKDEKIFMLYKFRTMTDARDMNGNLLPDEKRLTPFGRFLRKTSLDELPEVFNIIKGEMSVVGPRPLLVQYLPRYNEEQRHRHDVRPGLTGYAQSHGRNALTWEERFKMDVWYTRNISFRVDRSIFLRTIEAVLKREGISSGTSETMEEFMGTSEQ